jgi:hypothetical protein
LTDEGASHLAKPNYAFAKRQRDLAKQQKKEMKRQRKAETGQPPTESSPTADAPPPGEKTAS